MDEGERKITVEIALVGLIEVVLAGVNPETADALWENLPAESEASLWGDEIYFELPFDHPPEDARTYVEVGDVAWWPSGSCLCLFFGPTPASDGEGPVAASPVNVIGRISSDIDLLRLVKNGERIVVTRGH